jgi:hypothetical protein
MSRPSSPKANSRPVAKICRRARGSALLPPHPLPLNYVDWFSRISKRWRGDSANANQKRGRVLFSMRPEAFSRIFVTSAVLLCFALTAAAQSPHDIQRLTERVVPNSPSTYLNLVREIFPDTTVDADGEMASATRSIRLRRVSRSGFSLHHAPLDIVRVRGWKFLAQGGAKHLALLIEAHKEVMEDDDLFDWQYALAVFRYGSSVDNRGRASISFRLVEAIDPQEDRFVDLPDGLPLIEERSGQQSFWIINQHHNAGESFRDYKTIKVQSERRLQWLIEGLPGLHDTNDCQAREENRLEVAPRNNLHTAYLPVEFRLKTLRWQKNDCREVEEGVRADTEETRVYLARWQASPGKYRVLRVERWLERKQRGKSSAGDSKRFEGQLEVGKTYTADSYFDENIGWRLSERIKPLPHHAAAIEWIDRKRILPSLIKENRYSIEFKVLTKIVRRVGNSNRWNTTYKCAVRKALILIPPSSSSNPDSQ